MKTKANCVKKFLTGIVLAMLSITLSGALEGTPCEAAPIPILHYSFDSGTVGGVINGSTVMDSSPSSQTGTVTLVGSGTVSLGTGMFGQAMGFNSDSTNYSAVDVGAAMLSTSNANQPYTFAAWVKSDSGMHIINQYTTGDPLRWGIRNEGGGARYWNVTDLLTSSPTDTADDTWRHVVFTKDASKNLRVYIDGVDETPSGTFVHNTEFVADNTFVGAFPITGFSNLSGMLDEVYIFDEVLTLQEINYLMDFNQTFAPLVESAPVPAPGTLGLLMLALTGVVCRRPRR